MTMGGVVIEHASKEKYLGDIISELGCKQSIDETIKERMRKLTSKGDEAIQIADAPMMGCDGNSLTAIKLFEAQVIPALLFNCESWIGITDCQVDELQSFQNKFIRKLLHLPISTPKAILHWDAGMEMMKWRIAKRKMLFLRKLMLKDDSSICKRAIINESLLGVKGLGHECKELSTLVGLPDIRYNKVNKNDIIKAIEKHSRASVKSEVEASKKVGDRANGEPEHNSYLSYMTLPNSRIWIRVRARSVKGVKVNNKRSFTNLSCRFCDSGADESQEHLEECGGCEFERRRVNMTSWKGRVIFWRRMTTKISAVRG